MNKAEIECQCLTVCSRKMSEACKVCRHNTLRNKEIDYFENANDNPIPEKCPPLTYSGPAEQTAGYQCPVCGHYTNPYALGSERRCRGCGYKLNAQ